MKRIVYSLLLFLFAASTVSAQYTNIVKIDGSVGDCADPPKVTGYDNYRKDFLLETDDADYGDVKVTHAWVICQGGNVIAEVPIDAASEFKDAKFSFSVNPNGGGDFPDNLDSGVYEIKLKSCYVKENGLQPHSIKTSSESGDECIAELIKNQVVCCSVLVGCINYTACPKVSIEFDQATGMIVADVPPGATNAGITISNGTEFYNAGLSVFPKEGCWRYTVRAEFSNGCHDSASITYCREKDIEIEFEPPCKAPSIRFNPKSGQIGVRLPSSAIGLTITATNTAGQSTIISSYPFTPKDGCWTYTAVAFYENGCKNSSSITYCFDGLLPDDAEVPINRSLESSSEDQVKIYPTVFDETINLELTTDNFQSLQVFNSAGELIFGQEINGKGRLEIDGQQFVAGLYFVRIIDNENKVVTKKMIKQ